jgi:hypothetical protein
MDITLDLGFLHFLFLVIAVSPIGYLLYYKWTERACRRHMATADSNSYTSMGERS